MHALIAWKNETGGIEHAKTPATASIVVVAEDGSVIDTYRHREGQSEIVVNLAKALWVMVDLND